MKEFLSAGGMAALVQVGELNLCHILCILYTTVYTMYITYIKGGGMAALVQVGGRGKSCPIMRLLHCACVVWHTSVRDPGCAAAHVMQPRDPLAASSSLAHAGAL